MDARARPAYDGGQQRFRPGGRMATGLADEELKRVRLRAAGRTYALAPVAIDGKTRSLASEALRWGYVLRARERWVDSADARSRHEQDALRTLAAFGLDTAALQAIADADQVIVHMAYAQEQEGWPARVFPWEYVLLVATRSWRHARPHPFAVVRELVPRNVPSAPRTRARMLMVQSAPGRRQDGGDFDDELARLR